MFIGLLQDSLSGPTVPLGPLRYCENHHRVSRFIYRGAARYRAPPAARFALTFAFFILHQGAHRSDAPHSPSRSRSRGFNMHLIVAALVNGLVAVFLFVLLDRLRRN